METRTELPKQIGRFEVRSKLGHGLHGEVYRAHDPHLEREVAIKVLHPRRREGDGPAVIPDEARILALLRHPNIVSVFEAGLFEGEPYYVMEYVRGTTLRTLLDRHHRFSREQATTIMVGVLAGMAKAHAEGIAHLDLSPGNVLMDTNGMPRLMDFGLSRRADAGAETSDLIVGTPRYMTPEHFDFSGLGPRTDVYTLGLVLYEMLTGKSVVQCSEMREVARIISTVEPDWELLRARCNDGGIESILRVAMAKNPAARYADAGAFLTALAPLAPEAAAPPDKHATLAFLLHRMQRKQDFPALSRNLGEINRLTTPDSTASAAQVANVVLCDYAISNKLLKLANSAYYGNTRGSVSNVSEAVTLLGFERVRATCNGLMYFSHFSGKESDTALLDTLVASFVCGLMARHVATRMGLRDVEDAFLCGLFRGLGRSLTIYYFGEDFAEINAAVRDGGDETEAARNVLGISYDELAIAVAHEWKFPDAIVDSLKPLPAGALAKPIERGAALAAASGFAYGLVQMSTLPGGMWRDAMLAGHVERFAACVPMTVERTRELLAAALAKYKEFAPVLGVPCARSRFLVEASDLAGEEAMQKFAADAETPADAERTRQGHAAGGAATNVRKANAKPAPPAAAARRATAVPTRRAPAVTPPAPKGFVRRALRWLGGSSTGT